MSASVVVVVSSWSVRAVVRMFQVLLLLVFATSTTGGKSTMAAAASSTEEPSSSGTGGAQHGECIVREPQPQSGPAGAYLTARGAFFPTLKNVYKHSVADVRVEKRPIKRYRIQRHDDGESWTDWYYPGYNDVERPDSIDKKMGVVSTNERITFASIWNDKSYRAGRRRWTSFVDHKHEVCFYPPLTDESVVDCVSRPPQGEAWMTARGDAFLTPEAAYLHSISDLLLDERRIARYRFPQSGSSTEWIVPGTTEDITVPEAYRQNDSATWNANTQNAGRRRWSLFATQHHEVCYYRKPAHFPPLEGSPPSSKLLQELLAMKKNNKTPSVATTTTTTSSGSQSLAEAGDHQEADDSSEETKKTSAGMNVLLPTTAVDDKKEETTRASIRGRVTRNDDESSSKDHGSTAEKKSSAGGDDNEEDSADGSSGVAVGVRGAAGKQSSSSSSSSSFTDAVNGMLEDGQEFVSSLNLTTIDLGKNMKIFLDGSQEVFEAGQGLLSTGQKHLEEFNNHPEVKRGWKHFRESLVEHHRLPTEGPGLYVTVGLIVFLVAFWQVVNWCLKLCNCALRCCANYLCCCCFYCCFSSSSKKGAKKRKQEEQDYDDDDDDDEDDDDGGDYFDDDDVIGQTQQSRFSSCCCCFCCSGRSKTGQQRRKLVTKRKNKKVQISVPPHDEMVKQGMGGGGGGMVRRRNGENK